MNIEEAQAVIGGAKRWQTIRYLMIAIPCSFLGVWHMVSLVFLGYVPKHHCNVDKEIIPVVDEENEESKVDPHCEVYINAVEKNLTRQCNASSEGWKYLDVVNGNETTDFVGSTIVTEWDLVCEKEALKDLTQTVLVVGVIIGAMVFTVLADYIGRKPIYFFAHWTMVGIGILNAFIPNYYAFIVFRFFTGAFQQGIVLIGFVMACELFAAKYRTFAGVFIQDFWALGMCILPLIAYLISDWKYLQMTLSLFGLVTIPMYWFLPESLIWLCANDRYYEAERILQDAATVNKLDVPVRILKFPAAAESPRRGSTVLARLKDIRSSKKAAPAEPEEGAAVYTIVDVFKNKRLLIYAVSMGFLWMVNTMVYYGLSLSTATLAGNRFVNAFFGAFVEIPAYTSSYFAMQKWGRRYPLIGYHLIAGIGLILSQAVPTKTGDGVSLVWLIITFNMVGKFGITAAFGIVFLYAPEIFPTTLRGQAMGICSVLGRLGNVLATQTPYATKHLPWLPGPLFGGLSIAAGLLVILLPETHNRPLPQTIEDIENWNTKTTAATACQELTNVKGEKNATNA